MESEVHTHLGCRRHYSKHYFFIKILYLFTFFFPFSMFIVLYIPLLPRILRELIQCKTAVPELFTLITNVTTGLVTPRQFPSRSMVTTCVGTTLCLLSLVLHYQATIYYTPLHANQSSLRIVSLLPN